MLHFFRELHQYKQARYTSVFKTWYLFTAALMMGLLVSLNYYAMPGIGMFGLRGIQRFFGTYFLYLLPFAAAFLIQHFFYPNTSYLKSKWLWLVIILSPAVFSFRINFNFYGFFIDDVFTNREQRYWYYIFNRLLKIITLLLPVSLFWLVKDFKEEPLYGCKGKFNWQPYCLLILLMLPAVAVASMHPSFLQTYPAAYHAIDRDLSNPSWYWMLYEACYALDFLSIEYFFRGLLVIALIKICGLHAIVPAACFYCCIHFGKPMPEAIGSFFGALLLGVISYHTRSIWPGLMVHIGVAATIELLSYQQHLQ